MYVVLCLSADYQYTGTAYFKNDYTSILVFFLLGCVYIAIGSFISAMTESYSIYRPASTEHFGLSLMVILLWDGLLSFLPSSAFGGMAGIWMMLTLCVLFVYNMTKNGLLSVGIEGIGTIVLIVIYVVDSSLYEGILSTIFEKFALVSTFTSVAENNLLDIGGVVMYLTLIGVFLFLTVQSIQKRRFS